MFIRSDCNFSTIIMIFQLSRQFLLYSFCCELCRFSLANIPPPRVPLFPSGSFSHLSICRLSMFLCLEAKFVRIVRHFSIKFSSLFWALVFTVDTVSMYRHFHLCTRTCVSLSIQFCLFKLRSYSKHQISTIPYIWK